MKQLRVFFFFFGDITTGMVVKILIWILWFYDLTYPKQSGSFKNLCDRSRLIGSYDSNDPKQS